MTNVMEVAKLAKSLEQDGSSPTERSSNSLQ
jgi:hypothetical protein